MRNPVKVDPEKLSLESRVALMKLKQALADEGFMIHVQVTFDRVQAMDSPPVVQMIGFHREGVV